MLASNVNLIDGGGLRITGDDTEINGNYPGGMIISDQSYLYGYFECRCKLTPEEGTWPAFWMWPDWDLLPWGQTLPEIDIMEYWGGNTYGVNSIVDGQQEQTNVAITNPTSQYHTFACRWTPFSIQFYLDDVLVRTNTVRIPQVAEYILVGLQMGDLGGTPSPPEVFPCYFDIDYIKIWRQVL